MHLTGVVRDFRARNVAGGHQDFELVPGAGLGHYVGMVADNLDSDGKPVMASTGYRVSAEWRDGQDRNICRPRSYIAPRQGDHNGSCSGAQGGSLTTGARYAQWYRDVPGVNMSALVTIDLQRQAGTNRYVFDDQTDTHYQGDGFFCVNGRLLDGGQGGAQGGNRNYDFTYTIDANFTYHTGQGQYFAFSGNDDIWVFIDGRLVVDLGGMHGNVLQRIDLDRLSWLQDGHDFNMKFFYAQRNRPSSNLHFETSMTLRNIDAPAITDQFD
jgi:fibro-slime domain-containing protein